jgi:beta-lactamase superfamily II metal-dependent hydrolase
MKHTRRRVRAAATTLTLVLGSTLLSAGAPSAPEAPTIAAKASAKLRLFFIDVEGGQATLFVTPDGHSLLIDTGWPGNRDADRIVTAARAAGLSRIDAVLITHFHTDHVGGLPQLVERIPVGMFLDHGPDREFSDKATVAGWNAYQQLLASGKYQHHTMHPGETLPGWSGTGGIKATTVSADGLVLKQPLAGAGEPNPACGAADDQRPADVPAVDPTENARSLGTVFEWGKLRILDLGDLTWTKERELVCPVNKLGRFQLLIVSHHGWEQSTSPALLSAISPDVAIMDNGATKGGTPRVLDAIRNAPSKPALWELHTSQQGGTQHNTAPAQIANGVDASQDAAYRIDVTASANGSLTVTNYRTNASTEYPAR